MVPANYATNSYVQAREQKEDHDEVGRKMKQVIEQTYHDDESSMQHDTL